MAIVDLIFQGMIAMFFSLLREEIKNTEISFIKIKKNRKVESSL